MPSFSNFFTVGPYLDRQLPLEFPQENLLTVAEPQGLETSGTPEALVQEALAKPSTLDTEHSTFLVATGAYRGPLRRSTARS